MTYWRDSDIYTRRAGQLCNDGAQDQTRPCVGRLMPLKDFERAEWREPSVTDTGHPRRAFGPAYPDLFVSAVRVVDDAAVAVK